MPRPPLFQPPTRTLRHRKALGLVLFAWLGVNCQPQKPTSLPQTATPPSEAPSSTPEHLDRSSQELTRGSKAKTKKLPQVELLHPRKAHPWLGVELRARQPQLPGVRIARVLPGSPAESAQLQEGDIILSLDSQALNSPREVSAAVRAQSEASTPALLIERAGQTHLLKIRVEKMPEFEDRLRLAFVGRPAPEISGMVAFQGEVSSLKQLRGQVVILEFWASFCQVCRIMGPTLDAWHKSYLAQGAQVVGITVDLPQVGLEVARRAQMEYPLGSDPDQEITRTYMASQIPTLFIIDADGIVRDAVVGYSSERLAATEALIQRLLSERS